MGNRSKKSKLSISILKRIVLGLFTIFILFVFYERIMSSLKKSDYFAVKDIWYEASLKSTESSELSNLKGKNLLEVDLKKIQKQLHLRYPQYRDLMVVKKFPNQILVVARKRAPFAQIRRDGHHMTIDENGAILANRLDFDNRLPFITGLHPLVTQLSTGAHIENRDLQLALEIIKAFTFEKTLSFYRISKLDISNLSEIYFYIGDNLKIIIDQEDFEDKLKMLGLLLSQAKIEPGTIKYIDLRFKEPILGKK